MSTTNRDELPPPPTEYHYRRDLALGELMPAVGAAVGVGAAAFYIARLLLQRTPLGERPRGGPDASRDAREASRVVRRARSGSRDG